MLFKKTYKAYSKLKTLFFLVPLFRILKFKRTKWKSLQNKLNKNFFWKLQKSKIKKYKRKNIFFNNIDTYVSLKEKRVKSFYKISFELKKTICIFFNHEISLNDFKKKLKKPIFDRKNLFIELLIKPLFKLEILLWKLNFFKTISEIKERQNQGD